MKKELFLVRHAIAEDRTFLNSTVHADSQRPLTQKGIKKMHKITSWLEAQVQDNMDLLCTSALLRSQQTADIIAENFKFKKRLAFPELSPASPPEKICKKLDTLEWQRAIVVGHEPHLSHLICFLTGVSAKHYEEFELKKGGIAFFKFESLLMNQRAKLHWLVTPSLVLSSFKK